MKRFLSALFVILVFFSFPVSALAHPGRTDSSGGHHDYKNASGLGYYHYHHGLGPHLHPNGICPYAPKDTIKIDNQPSSMEVGDSLPLSWTVTYYSGNSSVSWSSSDSSILNASGGYLQALKPGTVTVTATLYNGSKSFKVTVKEVPVTEVSLSGYQNRIPIKQNFVVSYQLSPSNATYRDVVWSSSNTSVATVSSNGTVNTISPGTTTIKATSRSGKYASFVLEVYEILPERIDIAPRTIKYEYGSTGLLKATVFPTDTSDPTIHWTSSDSDIIDVTDTGSFQCKSEGTAVLTAICQNISEKISVEVYCIHAESILFDTKSMGLFDGRYMKLGDVISPVLLFSPEDTTLTDADFISDAPNIIQVDSENNLIASDYGTAHITAITPDTSATLTITVLNPSIIALIGGGGTCAIGGASYLLYKKRKHTNSY